MNKMMTYAAAVFALTAGLAGAQTRTIPGETKTMTASVEAIERASREVTVKRADGTYEVLYAPESFKRFDTLNTLDAVRSAPASRARPGR